jgi:tetratricopeptide (TPR) repeat protein
MLFGAQPRGFDQRGDACNVVAQQFADFRRRTADGYAAQGNRSEALAYLRQAVVVQPDSWEAHYYLGVELASREVLEEARVHFAEVVRLRPEYPLGHFNLAIALAKSGQTRAAAGQLEETLRLDPQNAKAAQYLKALHRKE